jgi:hypothetical protein
LKSVKSNVDVESMPPCTYDEIDTTETTLADVTTLMPESPLHSRRNERPRLVFINSSNKTSKRPGRPGPLRNSQPMPDAVAH